MSKIVMPKNSALLNEVEAVLKIYFEAKSWLENDVYKQKIKEMIGDDQYSSSYTKKVQITSYFGFTEWEDINNARSRRQITESGKRFYKCILNKNKEEMLEELIKAVENTTFGRNNFGCPESDSDIEAPSLFIRAIIDLGFLTYKEFGYLLYQLENKCSNYTDAIHNIKNSRSTNGIVLPEEAFKYTDAKPIMVLVRWGLLFEDDNVVGAKRIMVNPAIMKKYFNRLKCLKIYNVDKHGWDVVEPQEENSFMIKRNPRTIKQYNFNTILYGAPGTGKTYSTINYAVGVLDKVGVDDLEQLSRCEVQEIFQKYVNEGKIVFTTFHQGYGYEDFIQGMRPVAQDGIMLFENRNGVFKNIVEKAISDHENDYVIIIDEINRANISKVFGELITLIEEDKRWGELNELSVTLPSGDIFAIPNNLYIIGTMNSADKSISLIDTALRRRFSFVEVLPNASKITNNVLREVLSKINDELVKELGSKDLLIGHAYFMGKEETDLCSIFNNSIIPLLYEYFYDNEKKILKILATTMEGYNYEIDNNSVGRIRLCIKETKNAE